MMEHMFAVEHNENPQSFHTESEYSIISRPQGGHANSLTHNTYLPSNYSHVDPFESSPLENNSTAESEHLSMSHYALGTAYDHLKTKYKDLELTNKSLHKRLNSTKKGPNGVLTTMNHTQESDLNKAWESYTDKARECEKLRDELRVMEHKLAKSQNAAKDQSLRDDVLRAHSVQEDLKKQLQQAELTSNDLRDKEEMAKEELEKEKEFHEQVLRAAEKRHHEMESTIADLQRALVEKNKVIQELHKDQEKQRKITQDLLEQRDELHRNKVSELEGKVLKEQEERVKLAEELTNLQHELRNFHLSTGVPLSMSQLHQQRLEDQDIDSDSNSGYSDIDAQELVAELSSLTQEIANLKQQASQQSSMLSRLCDDPRIVESLSSIDCSTLTPGVNPMVNGNGSMIMPVQCTENTVTRMGSSSNDPSIDQRQIIDGPASSFDLSRLQNDNSMFLPPNSRFAVSRQIHAVREPGNAHHTPPPVKIEIPKGPDNVESAFSNLRNQAEVLHPVNHAADQDTPSSYYTTATGNDQTAAGDVTKLHLQRHLPSDSSSIDSQSSASETTIVNPIPERHRGSPDEHLGVRYPPSTSFGNDVNHHGSMAAVWPKTGKKPTTGNSSALWPPGTSSSRYSPSFDVISDQASSSGHTGPGSGSGQAGDPPGLGASFSAKEFAVQAVRRASDRNPSESDETTPQLPLSHPSNRPTNRARTHDRSSLPNQQSRSSDITNSRRRSSSGSIEVLVEDRAFMGAENPDRHSCPVCNLTFTTDASESFMQRHINAHFSDEEVDFNFGAE